MCAGGVTLYMASGVAVAEGSVGPFSLVRVLLVMKVRRKAVTVRARLWGAASRISWASRAGPAGAYS